MQSSPSSVQQQAMHELFSAATHDASAAMCRWTGGLISVTCDEVQLTPIEEAASRLNLGDDTFTMVILTLDGEIGGSLILVFDEEHGRELAASLLQRQPAEGEWTPLEVSALTETGNILGCAYVKALTQYVEAELVPSPPHFTHDFGASVLQQALMEQALSCDELLLCRIVFARAGAPLNWRLIFVPNEGMRRRMEQAAAAVC